MTTADRSPAARRARERVQVRDRILDAARDLFATEGYAAVTMRRVAEMIAYTPPVIYQHFADKESLIRELCRADFRLFSQSLHQIAGIPDPVERLRRMGEAYIQFALEHPHHYRVLFMTTPEETPGLKHKDLHEEDQGDPALNAYAFLRMCVDEAMAAGRFNPDLADGAVIAHVLWLGVHGIASMHVSRPEDHWMEYRPPMETAHVMIEALMRGLTCDATPAP